MNTKIQNGSFLISTPDINYDIFFKSIIFISNIENQEIIGFIINKKTKFFVHDFIKDFPIKNVPLYIGGPVETNSIFFIHKCENINNCVRINSNLFFGGDFKELIFKLKRKEIKINDIIFFIGYSGWSKNQLKEEIIKKYWITKNDKYLDLFNDNLKDWSEIIDDSKYYLWKNFPKNPSLN